MRNTSLAMGWITLSGIILVAVGLLGFISNPLVGSASGALVATDGVHNVVHIVTGLLALYIGFGLRGENQVNGVIGFGVLYVVIFVACLVSPNLFGIFSIPVNGVDHLIHAALALVSLAVGYLARGSLTTTAR